MEDSSDFSAKALSRKLNVLEVLCDAHPSVPEPSAEEARSWSVEEIRAYFKSGGEKPNANGMEPNADLLEPSPLPPSTRPDGLWTCQRIGCDAVYDAMNPEKSNPPGCCTHHPGAPLFQDGSKTWTCCQKKSHDFAMFMDIKGCAVGRHTQRKPSKFVANASAGTGAPTKVLNAVEKTGDAVSKQSDAAMKKEDCARCTQGFFCADHADAAAQAAYVDVKRVDKNVDSGVDSKGIPLPIDPHSEQVCRNVGCGVKFTEAGNGDDKCHYHPGPPIFHERKKGWACCGETRWDFDDFLKIKTCAAGRHNANPVAALGNHEKFAKSKPK